MLVVSSFLFSLVVFFFFFFLLGLVQGLGAEAALQHLEGLRVHAVPASCFLFYVSLSFHFLLVVFSYMTSSFLCICLFCTFIPCICWLRWRALTRLPQHDGTAFQRRLRSLGSRLLRARAVLLRGNRGLEYGIPRLHYPINARRFPNISGDLCNKTGFL